MKTFLISLGLIFIFSPLFSQTTNSIEEERRKYETFLNQHPYVKRPHLAPEDWKAIPKKDRPDLAWEHDFILTMDPVLGYVPKEKLFEVNKYVQDFFQTKTYGAIPNVSWMERGPNNVAGRTRAIMFDPNDGTNKKVWAGGVTGGLWYNEDITSSNSVWTNVSDFWANIAITSIAHDPTNPQVFYVGTGEGWGTGSGRGAGIWKSTDGGTTWNQLAATTQYYYINDLAVRNENGTGVLYAAVAAMSYKGTLHGSEGLFRSLNGGTAFSQVLPNTPGIVGAPYQPADIEIGADNRIYIGTRRNSSGVGGCNILYSDNGTNGSWTVVNTYSGIAGAGRVELACAPSDANIVYAMIEANNICERIVQSTNKGASWSDRSEPVDLDNGIPDTDFTRGQAWYNFILAVDPNNASIVYAGGVDLFRSTDNAGGWTHISKWANTNNLAGLNCSEVHGDQHAIVFVPGSSSSAIFGNDGGVYYTSDLANAATANVIFPRNNGYNVTQFYSCAINPGNGSNNYLAGAQDNGTQKFLTSGVNNTAEVTGGDGGFCFIDQDNPAYQITSYIYNNYYRSSNLGASFPTTLSSNNDGTFINPTDYDDRENILYSGKSTTDIQRITKVTGAFSVGSVAITLGANASHFRVSPYAPVGASNVFIGTVAGRIFKMENAHGASPTITEVTGNITSTGAISCIEIGASENNLLVTFSNYGVISVWLTNDGGANWINKEGNLPDMPVRWALFSPINPKQVLLATEVGIWSTDDINPATPDWQPTNSNFANVRVDILQSRTSDNLIAAATHGRGLFTTVITPYAEFLANISHSYTERTVTFTDKSSGANSWSWNFGPGASPATATTSGPHNVTYLTGGKKTVALIINNGVSSKTRTNYIHVLPDKIIPYLPADGGNFESNLLDFVADSLSNTMFQKGNSTVAGKNSVSSGSNAWVTGLTEANYSDNSHSILYAPNFNFSTPGAYAIQFKTKYAFEAISDGYLVESSTDKGNTWTTLGTVAPTWYNSTNATNNGAFPANTPFFSGTSLNTYETKSLDISSLAGNANVAFRFIFKTNTLGTDVGGVIDDFQITGPADITPPTVSTLSPVDNAAGVLVNANLVITFNENVQKGTGNILIKESGVVTQTINVSSASVTVAGTTVTIDPADFSSGSFVNIEIAAGAIKDMSGNNYAGITNATNWNFNVAADATAPLATIFDPVDNAAGVAGNANPVITFNENVQKGTGNILIKESGVITQTIDVTSGSVTVAGTTVTIDPNDFSSGAAVNIEMAAGTIRDMAGNNYAGITNATDWNFSVADVNAPLVTTFSPADNATGIAMNANLIIIFNENVQKGTGNILIKESGVITQTIDITSASVTVAGSTITINPNNFSSGAAVNIEIAASAIRDMVGNNYAGITNATHWNFSVTDITAPLATTLSPADNATGVAVNANLVITFNENVQKGTGNILIKESGVITQTIDVTSASVTVAGTTVTIDPADFSSGAIVNIEITAGAIRDMSGNNYAGITNAVNWNFSVADVSAPLAATFSPADNATGVAVGSNLVITFNENVQKGTGNILIKESGVITQTIDITSASVTVAGSTITINPNNFSSGAAVNIEVAAGAIRDMSGNNYVGITNATNWNFNVADVNAPLATTFSPADNATGVAVNANLVITFNENVQKGTGNILIKESGMITQTIDITSGIVTVAGTTVTIDPTDFNSGATVNIEVAAGAIRDISGNNYAGITNATNWNFNVADAIAPLATTFSPADNTTGVAVNANLVITFNENVQKGTGNILIKESGAIIQTIDITSGSVTVAGATVTINPNDFSSGAAVNIEIAAGAIRDGSGNNYAGITNAINWNFSVADASVPLAITFSPADNATGVVVNANLVITFNENIQKGTGNILIKESGAITQTIDISSASVTVAGTTLTINPADFSPGAAVNIEIAGGTIRDLSGNNYAGVTNATHWNFSVVDMNAPLATAFSPIDNATGVAENANLVITFNENVQKGTGNILIKESGGVTQTIDITSASVTVAGAILTINPNDFSSGAAVNIEIAAGAIRDMSGNNYAGITNATIWNFNVADLSAPLATTFSPADNATGVAVNANLVITFNENVQKGTGNILIKENGFITQTIDITSASVTVAGTSVTINPNNFSAGELIKIEIAASAIKDISGNNYTGITNDTDWNFSVMPVTGIEEIFMIENNIIAYPNPSSGSFTLIVKDHEPLKNIKMYTMEGKEALILSSYSDSPGIYSVITENLAIGIYFLKIETQKGLHHIKMAVAK